MSKKITTEQFVIRAKQLHGVKYNYSKSVYTKAKNKVVIICNVHKKEFSQTPDSHLKGGGCPKCGEISRIRKQTKEVKVFVEEAAKMHEGKYGYDKVNYKNNKHKITIICPEHGDFKQSPKDHLQGRGCLSCGGKARKHSSQIIKQFRLVHDNKYDYGEVEYKNDKTKIIIICPVHGQFEQLPGSHLRGRGCFLCGREVSSSKQTGDTFNFIKKAKVIHGDKYVYDKVDYIRNFLSVEIMCQIHGYFSQKPNHHLNGQGCPCCLRKSEGEVKKLLLKYFKDWTIEHHRKIWDSYKNYNHKRYCDFWLEKDGVKIIVEYDGEQHFRPVTFGCKDIDKVDKMFKQTQLKDKLDFQFCQENDIILHRIRYDEDIEQSIYSFKYKDFSDIINNR